MEVFELNGYDVVLLEPYGITPKGFEVRQAGKDWTVPYLHYLYFATYVTTEGGHWCKDEIPLSEGEWSILGPGTADKITEDEWLELIPLCIGAYEWGTAKEEGEAFIRMHKKEPGKIVICYRKK